MAAVSDNLIHFLARADRDSPMRQLVVFRLIIEQGLRTGKVQIKLPDGASVFNQIICFTDIPLRECAEHTGVYGKFGIGFKKSFVKNVGGNPARYFLDYVPGHTESDQQPESRGGLYLNLWMQHKVVDKLRSLVAADSSLSLFDGKGELILDAEELKTLAAATLYLMSFEKEMGDLGTARDETREIDLYYKEREWRLVPSQLNELSGVAVLDKDSGRCFYRFERRDVNMVVVPNEEARLAVIEYFSSLADATDERLREFATNAPPVINYYDLDQW